jgi:hypothetical protein
MKEQRKSNGAALEMLEKPFMSLAVSIENNIQDLEIEGLRMSHRINGLESAYIAYCLFIKNIYQ